MLRYNFETMTYEIVGDPRPDLLNEKTEDWGRDYDYEPDYADDDEAELDW